MDDQAYKIVKLLNTINRVSDTRIEKAEMIEVNFKKFMELSGLDKKETLKKIIDLERLIYTEKQKKSRLETFTLRLFKWH